ncbi:MAG: N-acetylmuramoyl-L-alanine amidase [Bacilli bacterium]
MKRIYYVLFAIITFFLVIIFAYAKYNNNVLKGLVFVIDPGHGGKDAGTSFQKLEEKDINLDLSLKLKEELVSKGATVYLTRNDDYDLSYPEADRRKKSDFDNRINYINNSNADMYFSIHINYLSDSRYSGPQVFYNVKDKDLAESIQKSLNDKVNASRDAKKISQNYYMYRKLNISGVLIECGFISNAKERKLLVDENYQEKLVSGIVDGVISYYINKNN